MPFQKLLGGGRAPATQLSPEMREAVATFIDAVVRQERRAHRRTRGVGKQGPMLRVVRRNPCIKRSA